MGNWWKIGTYAEKNVQVDGPVYKIRKLFLETWKSQFTLGFIVFVLISFRILIQEEDDGI